MTPADHTNVSDQLYANYVLGQDTYTLKVVVDEDVSSDVCHKYLQFH